MKTILSIFLSIIILVSCKQNKTQTVDSYNTKNDSTTAASTILSDKDIADAYVYLLGRELVLKQERLDFEKEGFKWNQIIYRTPGSVAWPNPNLDVAYSEAWMAVDENTCVILEIPEIKNRYYTWQMLNGWGETLLNINERTFPKHPYGKFAICLKGGNPKIPENCLRVDITAKTSRVLARVALGDNWKEATRLQHLFKLTTVGEPKIEKPVTVPLFEGKNFPDADMFKNASQKMQSEPDINEGMAALQDKTRGVEKFVNQNDQNVERVNNVIKQKAIPSLYKTIQDLGISQNGWTRPKYIGNYHDNYAVRTVINYGGIWANNMGEVTYFVKNGNDGAQTYILTFPKNALPENKVSYFWSIIAVDAVKFQVLPNDLKRYLLNKQSNLKYNTDGSLTLVFGPKPLPKYNESNWLPTIKGQKYNLTFRFYGPDKDVTSGNYFPPQFVERN